jgi:HD-GYP domain-containing protein (c-di-GMP phosphodiesterase class II)
MKIIKVKLPYLNAYIPFDADYLKKDTVSAFDIFIKRKDDYVIVIEAGTRLSEELLNKLKKHESLYIAKKDQDKQVLSCESLHHYIEHNKNDVKARLQLLYEVNEKLFDICFTSKDNTINLPCVEGIVKSIIFLVKRDVAFVNKTMPYFTTDFKIANHSLHVAIYAVKLGALLKFSEKQLLQLGTAGLLHDVGCKRVPQSLLDKTSRLSAKEIETVNLHAQYSVDIVRQNCIHDPYIIDAIAHHHERYDGSGYPEKQTKEEMSDFASILAICDVFDALTNNRPHRKEYKSFDALRMMIKDTSMINQFNQKYLLLALKSL